MNILLILFTIFINLLGATWASPVFATSVTVEISGTVPGCGDGIIQSGEECDGSNLNGQSCLSKGFYGGTLSCNANCTFNTNSCTTAPSDGGGPPVYGWPPSEFRIPPSVAVSIADFNNDGKVDIIDFSIMLFYFGKSGPKIKKYDLYPDDKINIRDISILLYYWTG